MDVNHTRETPLGDKIYKEIIDAGREKLLQWDIDFLTIGELEEREKGEHSKFYHHLKVQPKI